nr:MAG TPA: hypothetical protein [Bacteriophage sp.]
MPVRFNQTLNSDNTRVRREVFLPVRYKLKPGETFVYRQGRVLRKPVGIVRSRNEQV